MRFKKILLLCIIILIFSVFFSTSHVNARNEIDFDEDFYRNLFCDHGSIMLIIEPETGAIIKANDAASKFYGYSVSELEGMYIHQINTLSPDEIKKERLAAIKQERNYFLFPHRLSSGEIRTVEVYSYPATRDETPLLISFIIDVTEKINMQRDLDSRQRVIMILITVTSVFLLIAAIVLLILLKQRRYYIKSHKEWIDLTQYIIEHSPSAIAVHDKNLKYVFVSKKYMDIYKVKDSDIIGKHHYEVFPDLPEKWKKVHQRVLKGAIESANDDPFHRADGTIDYTKWEARPWYAANGEVGGLIIYTEVINEWKNQIIALKESEERFRLLVETAPDAIFLCSEVNVLYANEAAVKLLNASSTQEIIGKPLIHWLQDDHKVEMENMYKILFEDRLPVPNMEQTYTLSNGKKFYVEISALPIKYEGSDSALLYVKDISDRKKEEIQNFDRIQNQRHQQKLESIGTLASGVAHEINNPINGIINYAQLILDGTDPKCDCSEYAKEIIYESNRIAEIVRNLLVFARNETQSHSWANVSDIINKTLNLINSIMIKENIEIRLDIPNDIPSIKCRSQQIQQVMMNLITNSRDSLKSKIFENEEDKIINISVKQFVLEERKWIRITVEDNGSGIPDEIQERIFDPFFTTKSRDMGTGLGLPISYGIVKDHHGNLSFETLSGKFTRFHIDLPVDNGWNKD